MVVIGEEGATPLEGEERQSREGHVPLTNRAPSLPEVSVLKSFGRHRGVRDVHASTPSRGKTERFRAANRPAAPEGARQSGQPVLHHRQHDPWHKRPTLPVACILRLRLPARAAGAVAAEAVEKTNALLPKLASIERYGANSRIAANALRLRRPRARHICEFAPRFSCSTIRVARARQSCARKSFHAFRCTQLRCAALPLHRLQAATCSSEPQDAEEGEP